MNDIILTAVAIYFALISLITICVTCADKLKAENNRWRVPESTLMLLGFFGGAAAEYITMKLIRHKTLHKKFMIGLPIFILFHISLLIFLLYKMTA